MIGPNQNNLEIYPLAQNNQEISVSLMWKSTDELSCNLDLIIAADVLYDKENHFFLEKFLNYTPKVLIADSRVKTIDVAPYQKITEIIAPTLPDLGEPDEFKRVSIYQTWRK